MAASDIGKLALRIAVGGLMLFHGIGKIRHGITGIETGVVAHGLPHMLSYAVYIGEVVAPILVVVGLFARPAAAVMAVNMIVAVYLAHMSDLFHLGKGGGYALELQMLYFVAAFAIACIGAGRYAVRGD